LKSLKNMLQCKILKRNVSNIFILLKIIAPVPLFYIFGFNILFLALILWQFFDSEHYTLYLLKLHEMYAQTGVGTMNWIIKKLFNLFCFILCICDIFFKDLENYVLYKHEKGEIFSQKWVTKYFSFCLCYTLYSINKV
jgi:hypothetical protein